MAIDLYNLYAHRTYATASNWKWFKLNAKRGPKDDCAIIVRGAVCTATFARGPRKGQTNWDKLDKTTELEFVVMRSVLHKLKADWEAETGCCADCEGTGKVQTRFGEEPEYGPCRRNIPGCAAGPIESAFSGKNLLRP